MASQHDYDLTPLVDKLARHSPLGDAEIEALRGLPHRRAMMDRGAYLVREGDRPGHSALVLEGFVYRSKVTGNGSRQIMSVHLRGDLVCTHDHLLGEADHSIQALTRVEIACIPQQAILDVAEAFPTIGQALWHDHLVDASIYREWLLNVGQRDARQRLSHILCEMALRQEAAGICDGPDYSWPMTQEQVGDVLGLTPIHVNRTIQRLRRDKLIEMTRGKLTIRNWKALQREGDFRAAYLHEARRQRHMDASSTGKTGEHSPS